MQCVCASLPLKCLLCLCAGRRMLLLWIITNVVYWLKTLLLGSAAVHETPLLYLSETGWMLSCAYFPIVTGVELHCCCAPETKCSENASVCSCYSVYGVCVCVCVKEREREERESREALTVERRKVLSAQQLVERKVIWAGKRSSPFENFSESWQLKEEEPLHAEWNGKHILKFSRVFLDMFAQESSVAYFRFRRRRDPQRKTTVDPGFC